MSLPEGATFAHGEIERVEAAVKALAADHHAPRELSVRVDLHVHHEYPKHVVVGKDKDGANLTVVCHSSEEEAAIKAHEPDTGDEGNSEPDTGDEGNSEPDTGDEGNSD